ncbi:hypothetical protein AARAC_007458 [Aspergillus arachidicola]|uniref:T6SS Phospholipase effector Tle1-like catalytic domain-containing protein n=1 Tax=Aspergillus arachidicola TaxID=656916 RepID=A0A2G7G3I1_9EURO|nr:hypothetical protein AARAC_007458 [Aspergillus arachidicola]
MDGYRFLMRFYRPGDGIYIFGFSRGAYVARMLAEMLDHIGLLEAGNEGKVRYVWSIFSKWAKCVNIADNDRKAKDDVYTYMKALRETFCRPVSQIRFLGLFDTVNSIPRFELYRNRFLFPFTTKTSAKVIRHAVAIDEHRAKFRQDLLADVNPNTRSTRRKWQGHRERQPIGTPYDAGDRPFTENQDTTQDIEEVWFAGFHAAIGGGLSLDKKQDLALSHVPLVWMVQEAQRVGLRFDPEKMKLFHCFDDSAANDGLSGNIEHSTDGQEAGDECDFKTFLWKATINGHIHDFLRYGHGVPWPTVLSWKIVEYLPFRRMALQSDGSWKPIRWPLPLGERRDLPKRAKVHGSVIRRMEANPKYRPGNLLQYGKGKNKSLRGWYWCVGGARSSRLSSARNIPQEVVRNQLNKIV